MSTSEHPPNQQVYPGPRDRPPADPDVGLLDVQEVPVEEIVLAGHGADQGPYPRGTFRKIGTAMATLVALILATYIVPALQFARPWTPEDPVPFWNLVGRELLGEGAAIDRESQELEVAQAMAEAARIDDETPVADREVVEPLPAADEGGRPAYRPHEDDQAEVPHALEMPSPTALDPFFEELARTEAGYAGAIPRVVHWGDSVVANDNVTSTLRVLMQRRFGDAGHGFHLLAKPNASYRHRGVRFKDGEAWSRCYIINDCRKDGLYGLGGTTVWSAGGARSVLSTAKEWPVGRKVSRYELWYLAEPGAGRVRLTVDDQEPQFVELSSDERRDGWHVLEVEDGAHTLEVRAAGGGRVRLFGVVMERDVPGVVWDGMAQLGAFTDRMLNFDEQHIRSQIEHRDPGLLVFQFGGNDLQLKESKLEWFKARFTEVLTRFRGEDERRPCLVISPVDHGMRSGGRIRSVPNMERITQAQREVALAQGCAFYDTRAAMGGEDSVARWRRATPPLISGDLAHLTNDGQKALGRMVYLALMQEYRAYRQRMD